jgi:carboxypeptidase D
LPAFVVHGTQIPDVDFDIGESYAGLLPVTAANNSWLYFWYFPSTTPSAAGDLTIWLNGGPGCSSLIGLLQEHGPFLWKAGTFKPVKNPWTWRALTNIVYIEQPVGTGFSSGNATEMSSEMVATSFLSWFKGFVDTFGLHGKRIFLTGESYAGYYIPHIADAMFNASDKRHFDLRGTMIYEWVLILEDCRIYADRSAVAF